MSKESEYVELEFLQGIWVQLRGWLLSCLVLIRVWKSE